LAELRSHFDPKTFETVIPDLAQFERSVTDAVLLPEHAPSSPAARIAREFFAEPLGRSSEHSDGTSSSGKA
jgi:hypothetical protein